ncbi:MAG TPA: hypothetical protein VF002_06880, partial [Gaiellaceae bacterium]
RAVSERPAGDTGEPRGMTDAKELESLLAEANGGSVTLPRKRAHELAQKLKARGEAGAGAARLEQLLASAKGDVSLNASEARALLEELRASGRRWVFGSKEARELPSLQTEERSEAAIAGTPEPAPEAMRGAEHERPEAPPAEEPAPETLAEADADEAAATGPKPPPTPAAWPERRPDTVGTEPQGAAPEPAPAASPELEPRPKRRAGFFARLLGRRDE